MTPRKTNVVLIFADDLGAWALGAAGNPEIHTPNLDALAARGIRFENFFCTSPVCSPARASLLTGTTPSQHGVIDWIRDGNAGPDRIDYLRGRTTIPDVLHENGYRCALVGKWHLGASDAPRPAYEHWWAHEKGSSSYFGATMYRDTEKEEVAEYITDAIADDAIEYLRRTAGDDRPFYLNVSFTAPHFPWVDSHPQELVDLYAETPFDSIPREPAHPWLFTQNPEVAGAIEDPHGSLQGYFAAVTGLDRAIGRVVEALDELGIADETLVAFIGDNGFNTGHHGIWGKGNGTYPQNMFDTSVKVPVIFAQPGRIGSGRVSGSLLSGYDLLPTLIDYLAIDWTPPEGGPGRSFRVALDGDDGVEHGHVVVYDEYGPVRMIRNRDWKYVHRAPDGPHELYDLAHDPDERRDLIADPAHAGLVAQLRSDLRAWFAQHAAPGIDVESLVVTGLGQNDCVRPGHGNVFEPLDHPASLAALPSKMKGQ